VQRPHPGLPHLPSLSPSRPGATAPARTFLVTDRAWDAGVYPAVVANPCLTLILPWGEARGVPQQLPHSPRWPRGLLSVQPREQGKGKPSGLFGSLLWEKVPPRRLPLCCLGLAPAHRDPAGEVVEGSQQGAQPAPQAQHRAARPLAHGMGSVLAPTNSTDGIGR